MANVYTGTADAPSQGQRNMVAMRTIVYGVSRFMAWFGACVLAILAVVSVLSIAGRALSFAGFGPVPGDFEMVEAGTALAVFSFLPWCYLKRGHAVVDLLWQVYPAAMRRAIEVFADALMFVVWTLLVWRMGLAMLEHRAHGEVTFILQMPRWWGYAASMAPALLGCVAYLWRLLENTGLVSPDPDATASEGAH